MGRRRNTHFEYRRYDSVLPAQGYRTPQETVHRVILKQPRNEEQKEEIYENRRKPAPVSL
jgi:hypothetical protein